MKIKILLVDDHFTIRRAVRLLLSIHVKDPEVGEVGSCFELMKELAVKEYTHLILDIKLSDGNTLGLLPAIRKSYPDLRIMIFSMMSPTAYRIILRPFSIEHFLPKTASEEETRQVFAQFLLGEPPSEKQIDNDREVNPFAPLSPRELEILHYVLKGMRTKGIAGVLNLKMNTISTVKGRILAKTGTSNFIELLELIKKNN